MMVMLQGDAAVFTAHLLIVGNVAGLTGVCLALQTLVDVLPAEPTFSAAANLATAVGVKAQLLASPAPGSSVSLVVALVSAVHRYGVETFCA